MAKQRVFHVLSGEVELVDIPDILPTLSEAQQHKVTEITQAYQQATQTFTSEALGRACTYLSDTTSMAKFDSEHYYVNSSDYDGSPVLWYTQETGGVAHTKDQFNQAWKDGRTALRDAFNKWDSLAKQISAYTSEDDVPTVLAITW